MHRYGVSVAAMTPQDCRVAIHTGSGDIDLVLPGDVPVGALLPEVCDLIDSALPGETGLTGRLGVRFAAPGRAPLDPEKTLFENGIVDGALLVLTTGHGPPTRPPVLDCAAGLGRLSDAQARFSIPVAAMIAVPFAAVGGALVVPGAPGSPHLLLGASATGVVAGVAARRLEDGRTVFTALAFGAALIAAVSLGVTGFGGSTQLAGILLAVAGVGVLAGAGSLTLLVCGASPAVSRDLDVGVSDPVSATRFAPQCLTALVLAGAGTAAAGVWLAVARPAAAALAGIVAATLMLLARAHSTPVRRGAVLLCGTVCAAMSLAAIGLTHPVTARWLGAAALVAAVTAAGCDVRHRQLPPLAGQLAQVAENAGLLAIIPAACWALGLFDVARTMGRA